MRSGVSFATRLAAVLAAMLLLGSGLALGMNLLKFERLLLEQQTRVLDIAAGDLGETLENALALGVRLAAIPGAQALLERARAAEPLIAGLSIADAAGDVLFDTDRQRIGSTAAPSARHFRHGALHGIRLPILNGFGAIEGSLTLTFTRAAVDEQLTAALVAMLRTMLMALAIAVPLGILGIHLLTADMRRWFGRMESAMSPGASPEPQAAALQGAIGEAAAVLAAAEHQLESLAAAAPESVS